MNGHCGGVVEQTGSRRLRSGKSSRARGSAHDHGRRAICCSGSREVTLQCSGHFVRVQDFPSGVPALGVTAGPSQPQRTHRGSRYSCKTKIGHRAKPKRASATSPLRTGADMCKTGVGAGSSAGADKEPERWQSNHEWTDDQAGRRRLANTDPDGGSLIRAADETPS